ncbi:MAG: hypothetical protein Q7U54_00560 [Bacteroidales bacterium]|nr:hypothetical protein [Bacteroidales bacterium]
MKNKSVFVINMMLLLALNSNAQKEYPLLPGHPGTFEVIDWGVYTHWDCGFTKAEQTANYQKIIGITELVRKNPVFTDQKGFNCYVYVFAKNCPDKFGYGIPSRLRFDFGDWFMDKGVAKFYKMEPPSWDVLINSLEHVFGPNYSMGASKPTEKPKEGFNYEKWKSVSDKLHDIIYLPGQKEELGNGIDRYSSEKIVVYNPERPPYYLPVKFRELAELLIEYWKLHPEQYTADLMLGMLEAEYAQFPEAERDGWAYNNTHDERSPFLKITTIPGPQPVVRLNPEYWNKKLPRSAIQILVFDRLTDTKRYTTQKEEWLKLNAAGYSLQRFLEALDITTLVPAIDK